MKKYLLYITILVITSSSYSQNTKELSLKGVILENQQKKLIDFSKSATIIDSDTESYWAYENATRLLKEVNINGKFYFEDLSRIYSAYTYIFYGMSYSKTIIAISRGDNYSFKELSSTIAPFEDNNKLTKHNLSKKELASIYAIINFYKVSRMPKYPQMLEEYNEYFNISEQLFREYSEDEAYKSVSLKNKKLYYKTIVNLIIDLYLINNQNTDKETVDTYFKNLIRKGETLDSVPDNITEVSSLNEDQYFEYSAVCSKIQGEMIELLTNEIDNLARRN